MSAQSGPARIPPLLTGCTGRRAPGDGSCIARPRQRGCRVLCRTFCRASRATTGIRPRGVVCAGRFRLESARRDGHLSLHHGYARGHRRWARGQPDRTRRRRRLEGSAQVDTGAAGNTVFRDPSGEHAQAGARWRGDPACQPRLLSPPADAAGPGGFCSRACARSSLRSAFAHAPLGRTRRWRRLTDTKTHHEDTKNTKEHKEVKFKFRVPCEHLHSSGFGRNFPSLLRFGRVAGMEQKNIDRVVFLRVSSCSSCLRGEIPVWGVLGVLAAIEMTTAIPIFPLNTVLYPGGMLPLKIFEQRYLEMTRDCLRDATPFGVCRIREGLEVGTPALAEAVGCTAVIVEWEMPHLGVFHLK